MTDDHFTDTLRAVLDDPPLAPAETDGVDFTAAVTRGVRRRRSRHLIAGSLAAVAAAAGIITPTVLMTGNGHHATQVAGGPSHGSRQATTPTPTVGNVLSESKIVDIIMGAAAEFKDPTPTSIQYIAGTRNALSTFASSDTIDGAAGQAPSVLVEATGHFSMRVSGPVAYPDDTGTAILLVIDQNTGEVTDQGIVDKPVDLSLLGPVTNPPVPNR